MRNIYTIKGETLTGIADAIRGKNGSSDSYLPGEMPAAIAQIEIGGGTVAFNIAYGDAEPEDTSKLWVKTTEPAELTVLSKLAAANESLETTVAVLPEKAGYIAAAAVGTNVYLFGGYESSYTNAIRVFDTKTKTIAKLSVVLPKAASAMVAAAVGSKIYLFGGRSSSAYLSSIQMFDTESETITTLNATLPATARDIGAAVIGTKVYLFGGRNDNYSSKISIFDTENNTIATLGVNLPVNAYGIAAAAIGTKVYLFGGYSSNYSNAIYVFDATNNTIATLNTVLPASAQGIAAGVVGTKIYLFGGLRSGATGLSTINVFNPEAGTIETLPPALPGAYGHIAAAAVGGEVYLFGGTNLTTYTNLVNKFVASFPLGANAILLEASSTKNLFQILPQMELGVANVYRGNADGVAARVPAALYQNGTWVEI